jgi:hypothetical protein
MFSKGDRVTVTATDDKHRKCCLGRTGAVHSVSSDFVFVAGIDNRLVECLIGERAFRPDQLRKV